MKRAADFRAEARAALKGHWRLAVGVGFLAMVLGGVVGKSAGTVTGCVAFGSMNASGFKSSSRVLGSGNGTDCYYNSDAESNVTAKSFETAKTEEDLTAASFYSSIGFSGTVWNLSADLATPSPILLPTVKSYSIGKNLATSVTVRSIGNSKSAF